MVRAAKHNLSWSAILGVIACGSVLTPAAARAQDRDDLDRSGDVRREDAPSASEPNLGGDANQEQSASQGVVRLARFASVRGNVTWRADEGLEWSPATTNLPLRQSAQIWVTDGGRAEMQFDDGSVLRLGSGALVTLKTLYSDQDGEFTQITVNEGLATLRARHERSVYRMDTPLVSVTARGPARLRLGVGEGVEVAVREGQASVEGSLGKATIQNGDYLDLQNANTPYDARRVPGEDNWDRWNDERDEALDGAVQRPSHQYLPPNISIVASDLDDNGTWRDDAEYGHVWCPRVESADWRPYYHGHWTWVNPFGWTWVSDESWGWAPYHYGTWVSRSYGWAWRPGPVNQYWSPAVVHFTEYGDRVAWCPLAPAEVRYPSLLSVGFRSGNWSLFFSIGQAAVYYPSSRNYCEARPFNTGYVNHVSYIRNVTNVTNVTNVYNNNSYFAANRNQYITNNGFVPINARGAAGATYATRTNFGARAGFQTLPQAGGEAAFRQGRTVGAPIAGQRPLAGPLAVQPTRESLTPLHTFSGGARPSATALNRTVYHAPLPASVGRRAFSITPSGDMVTSRGSNAPAGASDVSPGRPAYSGGAAGRTQQPANSSVRTGDGGARVPGGNAAGYGGDAPAYNGGSIGRSPVVSGQAGVRSGDARTSYGAAGGVGRYGERTGRPSQYGGASGSQAAAQARASLGLPAVHAQSGAQSGGATESNGGRTYRGGTYNTPSGASSAERSGGSFNRPSSTMPSGNGSFSRPSYGSASGTQPSYGGSDGRAPRPGYGGGGSGSYDRTRGGESGGESRYPTGRTRPSYTPSEAPERSRPSYTPSGGTSYTPPSRPSGAGGGNGSGYDQGGRNYDGRTSAPSSGGGNAPRSYLPPAQRQYTPPPQNQYTPPAQRQYSPPPQRQSSPPASNGDARLYSPPTQRQYTPPPARTAPSAPRDRGGDTSGRDNRSGDGKNRDGKSGKP